MGYFGSYARGDWGVGSDLDLVVIVDVDADGCGNHRSTHDDLESLPVPAEMLEYTDREWDDLMRSDRRIAGVLRDETVWLVQRGRPS